MDVGACFLWVAHNRTRFFRCRSSVSPDLRQGIAGFLFLDRNKKWTPAGPEAPRFSLVPRQRAIVLKTIKVIQSSCRFERVHRQRVRVRPARDQPFRLHPDFYQHTEWHAERNASRSIARVSCNLI